MRSTRYVFWLYLIKDLVFQMYLPCDYSGPFEGLLKLSLVVSALLLDLPFEIVHVRENRVLPHYLEADIDVQEYTSLLHDKSGIESWPHLDLVSV